MHIVEERPGRLEGLPYFEVKFCTFITNTSDSNAFKMIWRRFEKIVTSSYLKKNLFSQERAYHAAVVVDGKEDIIIFGGGGRSTWKTGEIVKSK